MSDPKNVVTCVYTHRHGEDVWVFDTMGTAHWHVAVNIIEPQLKEEFPADMSETRDQVSALITAGKYSDAIDMYCEWFQQHSADAEDFSFYENEVITAPPSEVKPVTCKCPQCGNEDLEEIEIKETYTAYHPVRGDNCGKLAVENALATSVPSIHFDEGASDFMAHCRKCAHTASPESFGLPDTGEWDWI